MDNWMKGLIAAACGVVVLTGGAFGWSFISDQLQKRADTEMREDMRANLFRRAKAEAYDVEKVRSFCDNVDYYIRRSDQDYIAAMRDTHRDCLTLGYR